MTAKVTLVQSLLLAMMPRLVRLPNKSFLPRALVKVNLLDYSTIDKVSDILWTSHFLEALGYKIKTNVVYQDNMSTLSLAKNGYFSSSK
jgi:hypothetical protein